MLRSYVTKKHKTSIFLKREKMLLVKSIFFLLMVVFNCRGFDIAPLAPGNIETVIACDAEVSFEYFAPYYRQSFSTYEFGQYPEKFLAQELASDVTLFNNIIKNEHQQEKKRFYLAAAMKDATCIGFILWSQEANPYEITIELLLVLKAHRHTGVGRKLITDLLKNMPTAKTVLVYPFKVNNTDTLAFYKRMGFIEELYKNSDLNPYGVSNNELYTKMTLTRYEGSCFGR